MEEKKRDWKQEIIDGRNIIKEPFRKYRLDEEKENDPGKIFTIRLNKEEVKWLGMDKKILQQKKDSTALKQLAMLGHNVLHDRLFGGLLETLFKNKENNRRIGISDFE